jgi:hypothetical protein
MNLLAPKGGTLQMGIQKHNGDFVENCSDNLDYISEICGAISLNKAAALLFHVQ